MVVGCRPSVEIATENLDALTTERYILSGARQDGDIRIFFIACGHTNAVSFAATFDADGHIPEVRDAETCEMGEASAWRILSDGRVQVDFEMKPNGSRFAVFRQPLQGRARNVRSSFPFTVCRRIDGPWRVRFAPGDGAAWATNRNRWIWHMAMRRRCRAGAG